MPDMMPRSETDSFSAIYLAARREWNERYGSYISRARRAQVLSGILAGSLAVSAVGNAWQAQSSHVEPFIVKVNQLGEIVGIQRIPKAPIPDEARIKAQLERWVTDVRTVYSDPIAELNIATEAYAWTEKGSAAIDQLDTWFRSTKPNERAQKEEVGVEIESAGPVGANTWEIDWTENHTYKDGRAPSKDYWLMRVRIKVAPPKDDKTLMANTNGVYSEWFNVSPRTR